MLGYLVRRLAMTIPTLLLVAITVFALVRLIPGDPVQVMLGDSADPAQVEQLRRQMGLDQSIPVQFGYWLAKVAVGGSPYGSLMLTVLVLTAPASLSASATRLHDRGMPAWWLLLGLVPYLGSLALLVLNGFLRGDGGPNRYGPPTGPPSASASEQPLYPPTSWS